MKRKLAGLAALSLLAVAVSGCSRLLAPAGNTPPTPAPITRTPQPTNPPAASALPCRQGGDSMQLLTDEAHNFCVLVPKGFTISQPGDTEVAAFVGPMAPGGPAVGWIMISDAQGKSAAENAAPAIADAQNLGISVTQQAITVGGEPAVMVDGLPGQDMTRKVFVVHGGVLYELGFTPSDSKLDTYPALQSLYEAVVGSFTFLR